MNKRDKKKSPQGMVPGLIVLFTVMIFNFIAGATDDGPVAVIAAVACFVVAVIVAVTVFAVKRAASGDASAQTARSAERAPAEHRPTIRLHADEAEEAIHCSHVRGKQKYIEQLESYLKNGIIDKAEYRVLKERYEKLDIPDDYH